ncbi:olfactory receptor 5T18-like [Ctenodactylus gundi]
MGNRTEVTEFILLGLTSDPDLRVPLFVTFLLIYAVTVAGNLGMVLLILLDSRLHTPMYFFLGNLSLVDFSSSSVITPTVMAGLLVGDQVISHHACATQMFLFALFIATENYLLASMAYDRYVAVCKPLHYTTTMTPRVCACLITGCYVLGVLSASIHVGNTFSLSFCQSSVVHHFFCDVPAVMVLSCSDRHVNELVLVYLVSFHIFFALLVIWISYVFIFVTVLKIYSSAGPQKALSTCASHLTTVSVFYGTGIFMYLQPSSSHSMDTDKISSVFYTIAIPMLNPVVYSLRNRDVKAAFFKVKNASIWWKQNNQVRSDSQITLMGNRTEVTAFILLGLTDDPDLQVPLFVTFLLIYTMTVIGNLGMVLLILLDSHLHTPMYFFLGNLSLVDFSYSSAVTPTVMAGLLVGDQAISYNACVTQMLLFAALITTDNYILASMAYDRYAAVCKPLHYTTTVTTRVCACLITGCYVLGLLNASVHVGNTFSLSFCESNVVHHFFCDIPAVMVLSCSDRHVSELVLVYGVGFHIFFALLVIWISYVFIFVTMLRMRSGAGHQKALSTCASHLMSVSIFYGTSIFMYLQPSTSHSMDTDKMASVFYTVVIPMLNPVVYSLRNKEVRRAFFKVKSAFIFWKQNNL